MPPSAAVSRSVSALVKAAGLPGDKLSASIISFARFFSLPIKPELMAAIRHQAVASSAVTTQPDTENTTDPHAATKSREALSLAAAAAHGKGIELNQKGLEVYAAAIDPAFFEKRGPGERNPHGKRSKDHGGQKKENIISESDGSPKAGFMTGSGLKEMALKFAETLPLLAILNKLPGKNGQRWIVLPFSLYENGKEFRVSLRILLEGEIPAENHASRMALDIAENGEIERRWLFVLDIRSRRLSVYFRPEPLPGDFIPLAQKLSRLLEIPPDRISVEDYTASFPCESGCNGDPLRSINEAV
jgi:hypothetical protein